jgi:hypothetical protein
MSRTYGPIPATSTAEPLAYDWVTYYVFVSSTCDTLSRIRIGGQSARSSAWVYIREWYAPPNRVESIELGAPSNEVEPTKVRYGRPGYDRSGYVWPAGRGAPPNGVEPAEVRYGRPGLVLPRMGSSRPRSGMAGRAWCSPEWGRAGRGQILPAGLNALPNGVEPAEVRYDRPGLVLPRIGLSRPRSDMIGRAWCSPKCGRAGRSMTDRSQCSLVWVVVSPAQIWLAGIWLIELSAPPYEW